MSERPSHGARFQRAVLRSRARYGSRGFVTIVTLTSVFLAVVITSVLMAVSGVAPDMVIPSIAISVAVPALVAPPMSYFVVTLLGQLEEANARLSLMVGTDVLTGLANRRGFFDVAESLVSSGTDSCPLIVGMVDLDEFKAINDRLGHHQGDLALRAIGARLAKIVGTDGIVGRIGGDEFALMIWGDRHVEAVDKEVVSGCRDVQVGPATVSATVGFSVAIPGESIDLTLARADADLYRRKAERRSRRDPRATAAVSSAETVAVSPRR